MRNSVPITEVFPIRAGLIASALLVGMLPAQTATKSKLGQRSFFQSEYTTEYFIDVDALQDTDLWDVIERSVGSGIMFGMFRKEFGFRLRDIRKVRATGASSPDDQERSQPLITVIEGRGVCLPPIPKNAQNRWKKLDADQVAGYDVMTEIADGMPTKLYVVTS